jgi:aspartate/methionine/tyrosine aminotransferase
MSPALEPLQHRRLRRRLPAWRPLAGRAAGIPGQEPGRGHRLLRRASARHPADIIPEGTYLIWLDCRGLGLDDAALRRFFVEEARVGMNPGTVFGAGGSGFMRLNLGAPRSLVMEALGRMAQAWSRLGK